MTHFLYDLIVKAEIQPQNLVYHRPSDLARVIHFEIFKRAASKEKKKHRIHVAEAFLRTIPLSTPKGVLPRDVLLDSAYDGNGAHVGADGLDDFSRMLFGADGQLRKSYTDRVAPLTHNRIAIAHSLNIHDAFMGEGIETSLMAHIINNFANGCDFVAYQAGFLTGHDVEDIQHEIEYWQSLGFLSVYDGKNGALNEMVYESQHNKFSDVRQKVLLHRSISQDRIS